MKYNIECLVDEYVSCSADMFVAKKLRLPNIVFHKKGQGVIFQSSKEFEPYARGFNGLAQLKKVIIKAESNGPEPKRDIEVTLSDVHKNKLGKNVSLKQEAKVEVKSEPIPSKKEVKGADVAKPIIPKIPKELKVESKS